MQVITAADVRWIEPFTGLKPKQFRRLVRLVARAGGDVVADGRPGRPWRLGLADRVLLVACYYRTNLTTRQLALLFGLSAAGAFRVIDRLAPFVATVPFRPPRKDTVLIVDGTLIPVRDPQVAAVSKNYRHSVNMQVVIDAENRLVVAVGRPLPGNHNDCTAYADSGAQAACAGRPVIADGGYRGTPVIMPFRRRAGHALPDWQEHLNTEHRRVRARVEHTFARMKNWKILRDCRRRGHGVHHATLGIAVMHNLTLTQ